MNDQQRNVDEHVGDMLSGYVDGELTQQQRQLVTIHCRDCEQCQQDLDDLKALRERVAGSKLSEIGEDKWRESMPETGVQNTRSIGWILFLGGLLVIVSIAVVGFLFSDEISAGMKLLIVAIYGGLGLLFVSVLRQRLIERKTDKYKDVEI